MTEDQIKAASKILNEIDLLEHRQREIQSGFAIRSTLKLPDKVQQAGEEAMCSILQTMIDELKSEFDKI